MEWQLAEYWGLCKRDVAGILTCSVGKDRKVLNDTRVKRWHIQITESLVNEIFVLLYNIKTAGQLAKIIASFASKLLNTLCYTYGTAKLDHLNCFFFFHNWFSVKRPEGTSLSDNVNWKYAVFSQSKGSWLKSVLMCLLKWITLKTLQGEVEIEFRSKCKREGVSAFGPFNNKNFDLMYPFK